MSEPAGRRWILRLLPCLVLVGLAAQIIPFAVHHVPDATVIAATKLPAGYPAGYDAADFARAEAFSKGMLFGGIGQSITLIMTVLSLVAWGFTAGVTSSSTDSKRAWLIRVLFLAALFLCLRLVEIPYLLCRFHHFRAFELTPLTLGSWTKLMLLGIPVPLSLFILKYLLVICAFPLFRRFWWIGACLCVFIMFEIVPEVASRRYPLDPVETLSPLKPCPHADAIKAVLDKANVNLPLMMVDLGNRANTANIYIAGRHGREYVVVTDTFLRWFTPEDAALALGHELGHIRNGSIIRITDKTLSFIALALGFLFAFLLAGRAAVPVSAALHQVLILMLCLTLSSFLLQPVSNAFYRAQELQADKEAVKLVPNPAAFGQLLVKMSKLNLEPLDMPGWEKYLFSSYPPVLTRLAVMEIKAP